MQKKAIILFSGGLDSTTCFAVATSQGYDCYALSFLYGQKHHVEIENASRLAKLFGAKEHKVLSLPLGELGGSSLTDTSIDVADYAPSTNVPLTYVPGRNTIFLTFAMAWGEVIGAYDIFIGANVVDYSGYPDCRPEFLRAFETLAKLGTKAGEQELPFQVHSPLIKMSKADIIHEGMRLGVDFSQTVSCYRANAQGEACGKCDSCTYRKKGFAEANVPDPTRYMK